MIGKKTTNDFGKNGNQVLINTYYVAIGPEWLINRFVQH